MNKNLEEIKKSYLFKDLSEKQIKLVLSLAKEIVVPKDTYIIQEGERGNDVYLLLSGKVAVRKKDKESGEFQLLGVLESGEIIGEIPLIDNQPRSASVCTLEDSKILIFYLSRLASQAEHQPVYLQIKHNISNELARRFRKTDELTAKVIQKELEGSKIRIEMGRFLFYVFIILSSWVFFISFFERNISEVKYSSYISFPVISFLFLISIIHAKQSIYPWSFYGLTLKRWQKNALEGVVFSLPILLVATILKVLIVKYIPSFNNETIININNPKLLTIGFFYILLTGPQEFIARGNLQSSIKLCLLGSNRSLKSVILSSLLFASFHSVLSPLYALAAFILGLYWGWLYLRQESLVGCTISHALIGGWSLAALGLGEFFFHY